MTSLQYSPDGAALRFAFDYDRAMVAALKSTIPSGARRWDPASKAWMIAPQYEDVCRALALQYLRVNLSKPQPPLLAVNTEPTTELIELRYLGQAKDRGGDDRSAYGHDGQDWRFIFPESVLRAWFGLDSNDPAAASTLYAVLGIGRGAAGAEIKRAFRAAARQWHPDVCSEPNATQIFQRINEAYEVLSNPATRARYDAGLALEASVGSVPTNGAAWKPPLRCGYLLVTAIAQLGRLLVQDIHQWTEIVDGRGRALVTSWRFGDDSYTERWI